MSPKNVEIVRRLYEAWNRGDNASALESIDPEIEVDSVIGGLLEGTYRGHAGLLALLEAFWDQFEDYRTEVEECIPEGDEVVVVVHHHARGKSSGVKVDMRQAQVWTLRDGKAVRWRIFRTRREALEAAGIRA